MQAPQKAWTSLWSCSWGFCGLQILHIQDQNQIGWVPSQKHILALHTSATSAAGVSAGVSAFTYRHNHGTVNNLWNTPWKRWFVFALESLEEPEEPNTTTFTIVVLSDHVWKKFPGAPCTCCVANASSFDINTGVKVQIPLAINSIGNLATEVACFGYVRLLDSLFDSSCGYPPHTTSYKNSTNTLTCASLFASFLNMLPRASAAGVSAFTYQSIDQTNTPYGKQKDPFRSLVKNDVCMSALR